MTQDTSSGVRKSDRRGGRLRLYLRAKSGPACLPFLHLFAWYTNMVSLNEVAMVEDVTGEKHFDHHRAG